MWTKTSGSWCGVKGFIIFGICNNGYARDFWFMEYPVKHIKNRNRLKICKKLLKHSWDTCILLYLLVFAGWIRQFHTPWWHDPDTPRSVQIAPRLPGTLESVKQKFYLDTALSRHLKKLTCKWTLPQVFICLRPSSSPISFCLGWVAILGSESGQIQRGGGGG